MPKKKPTKHEPKKPPEHPPGLADMKTRDLLRSIRDDLADQARKGGLVGPESPVKPPRSR